MSRHANAIFAKIESADATSVIAASWRRCANIHRLDPDDFRIPDRDPRILREALDRDARLIAVAAPHLDALFDALGDPDGSVNVLDRFGTIIALRVGSSQDVHRSRPERFLGADLSEAAAGTNGNGTCLVEERPVTVSGADHFKSLLTPTVCIAAPIFAPDGSILGCLNVLTQASHPQGVRLQALARSAVRWSARCIEIALFAEAFPRTRIMLAPGAEGCLHMLLAVDRDGVVLGATRAARRRLDLDAIALRKGVALEMLPGDFLRESLADSERKTIALALARHAGNISQAARSLGISRSTLYRKIGASCAHR